MSKSGTGIETDWGFHNFQVYLYKLILIPYLYQFEIWVWVSYEFPILERNPHKNNDIV
jgi:hypothetical protein